MERNTPFTKVLATVLCIMMLFGVIPFTAFAATSTEEFKSETHTVFKHTESTLAPGVTQSIKYAYAKDDKQMVYYVATADVTRDDVIVQTSYKDQYTTKSFGMQKLTDQIAYANALYTDKTGDHYISDYYNVVAGVNASFYNMTTGQPSGITYLDGVQIGESSSYAQFFAMTKDGKAVIDYTKNLSKYTGNIDQAVAGSQMLVWDGADVTANVNGSYNTDRHSRTCVGVTADGKVVVMVLDGRQEPFSCGGTMHELAQIMLEAACVAAINLDGGGSTTYVSKAEGENEVSLVNRPSDGSERTISSGLIIASLAVPSDTFDHVSMTVTDEYVTPGTSTTVKIAGVSAMGSAAKLPVNITYEVTNGTYENGVLTAAAVGDVVLTAKADGIAVGSITIHAVIPTAIEFNAEKRIITYDKTVEFEIAASVDNGLHPVKYKDGDIVLTMSSSDLGTVNGLAYKAAAKDSGVASGVITAKLTANESVSDTIAITLTTLPDEPVIYEDFENKPEYRFEYSEWYYIPFADYKIVDNTTGKVHSGDHALAITVALRGSSLNGYHGGAHIGAKTTIYSNTGKYDIVTGTKTFEDLDLTNAKTLGMWIYIPEDSPLHYVQFRLRNKDSYSTQLQYRLYDYGYSTTERGHTGWQYFELDFDEVNTADVQYNDGSFYLERIDIYACTRNDEANQNNYGYNRDDQQSVQGPITFYFDDITVEYVDTGMDNVDPTFDYVRATYGGMSDSVVLNGQTITSNVISVTARASDAGVGIDSNSAKAYIDGVEVTSGFRCDELGIMTIDDVTLADGTHSFTFVISDKNGNCEYVTRQVTIDADSGIPTASLKLAEELTSRPLFGQVVWMNLEVDSIENVNTISTILNLNIASKWELDNMIVAYGFEASYTIDSITNDATITITQTGKTKLSGHNVVVQIPIRMYYADPLVDSTNDPLSNQTLPPEDIKLSMDMGLVRYKDETSSSFSMTKIDIDSERYSWYDVMNGNGDIVSGYVAHIHTAKAIDDKNATCTEAGYTGRTYCETCKSVVDWGTTVPATGHTYKFADGVLKCDCGETFGGVYTDGKHYTNGLTTTGWVEESYYANGVLTTGIQLVDGLYYDFGDDGVCEGKATYNGLLTESGSLYYIALGVKKSGWYNADGNDYYFNAETLTAVDGAQTIDGHTYKFVDCVLKEGSLERTYSGYLTLYWAGRTYYNAWLEVQGKTYHFDAYGHLAQGLCVLSVSTGGEKYAFVFNEDTGVLERKITGNGLIHDEKGTVYLVNDVAQYAGLIKDGSDYYYINSYCKAVTGTYWVAKTNGLLSGGYYEFGEDGKLLNPPAEKKNGISFESDGTYYYVDGRRTYAGLVKHGEDYYYFNSYCKAVTGTYWVAKTNDLLPGGNYKFDETGKMLQGLVEEDDELYYYVNGRLNYAGLVKVGEDYYYFNSYYKAVTGTYWVSKTNDLLPVGNYKFDENGKMLQGLVEENGAWYYYVNGKLCNAGLIKIGEDYYYINSSCKAVTGTYWVYKTNDLLPEGNYKFDENGKMLQGLVEEDGALYYYVNGRRNYAGLIKIGEDYYYINSSCKAVTGTYWVYKTNDLLPGGNHEFAEDGKMIKD